jgi:hypothetical protein
MASFTVTGTLQGYSAPPTLQYRDDVPLVTTWDTGDFTGPYSFTNGNKTATYGSSGSRSGVRATTAILAGQKVYFEVATSGFVSGSGFSVGVCQKSWPLGQTGDGAGGSTAVGDFCVHWDGVIDLGGVWINNPHQGTASFANGGILRVAVDMVHSKLWWQSSLNTSLWDEFVNDDPATNTLGWDISSISSQSLYVVTNGNTIGGAVATINGGSSAFTYSVPSGFTPLDGIPNAWLTLPAGSTVTASTFSFPHTNIPNTGPHTISVRDANATTVTTTSNSFNVT